MSVHRTIGSALIVPLLMYLTGCGGYQRVDPDLDFDVPPVPCPQETVEVGDMVKVVLKTGDKIQGEVLAKTPEGFTFGKSSNYGYQEYSVAFSEIESLEVWRQSQTETVFVSFIGALLIVAMGTVMLMAYALRGANFS